MHTYVCICNIYIIKVYRCLGLKLTALEILLTRMLKRPESVLLILVLCSNFARVSCATLGLFILELIDFVGCGSSLALRKLHTMLIHIDRIYLMYKTFIIYLPKCSIIFSIRNWGLCNMLFITCFCIARLMYYF